MPLDAIRGSYEDRPGGVATLPTPGIAIMEDREQHH
jgi:hypothetical protein